MGYSGLSSWSDSDMTASFVSDLFEVLIKKIRKQLKVKENEFNTDGIIDVCLFFETFIYPINAEALYDANEDILVLLEEAVEVLEKKIEQDKKADWSDEGNKSYHISRYKELLKNLKKYKKKIAPLRALYND